VICRVNGVFHAKVVDGLIHVYTGGLGVTVKEHGTLNSGKVNEEYSGGDNLFGIEEGPET